MIFEKKKKNLKIKLPFYYLSYVKNLRMKKKFSLLDEFIFFQLQSYVKVSNLWVMDQIKPVAFFFLANKVLLKHK